MGPKEHSINNQHDFGGYDVKHWIEGFNGGRIALYQVDQFFRIGVFDTMNRLQVSDLCDDYADAQKKLFDHEKRINNTKLGRAQDDTGTVGKRSSGNSRSQRAV